MFFDRHHSFYCIMFFNNFLFFLSPIFFFRHTQEVALCSEIRDLLNRTREQIEMQLIELKAAKARMENDWTDKIDAYKIDTNCLKMNNESPLILWKPGATRFPAE